MVARKGMTKMIDISRLADNGKLLAKEIYIAASHDIVEVTAAWNRLNGRAGKRKITVHGFADITGLDITIHQATVGGKGITFTSDTEFLFQCGKGKKGEYNHQEYKFAGADGLVLALGMYDGMMVSGGFKKRLVMRNGFKNPVSKVLLKETSA